jgi:hypothetical protein
MDEPKHSRPLLESLLAGEKDTLSREEMLYLMQEAAPRLRPNPGPDQPPNPYKLPWLVVGSASCVYDDLRFKPYTGPTIAVNRAMLDLDIPVDIGCTLHHEITRELMLGYNGRLFCSRGTDYVTDVLPVKDEWRNGTSGLYAVQIALHFGAPGVILCGMPIDDSPHFHRETGLARGIPELVAMHRQPWIEYADFLRKAGVRSMSGWTRELLGSPLDYNA